MGASTKKIPHANFLDLVDIVTDKEDTIFLLCAADGELYTQREVEISDGSQILIPPEPNQIPFLLLEAEYVINYDYEINPLYRNIVSILSKTSKLPNDRYYHLCATYIFLSYLTRSTSYFPYLWLYGLPERGKSRIVKVLANLLYRGFYTETLNPAPLFRFADGFSGSIALDLYEIIQLAKMKGAYDFLLSRFEQGIKVSRVTNIDKGPYQDIRYFEVFGPTIIATNKDIPDHDPLRSRCIQIIMPEARGKYPNIDIEKELWPLKAGLLYFRAKYMNKPLPDAEKPTAGRLGDLMQPLFAVAELLPKEALENLRELIGEIQSERNDAESNSLPGQIAEVLWTRSIKGEVGKLKVAEICRALNAERPEKYHVSAQEVGSTLAAMGIKRRKSKGVMHVVWDEPTMQNLFERFDINQETVPLLSPASLSPERIGKAGGSGREASVEASKPSLKASPA